MTTIGCNSRPVADISGHVHYKDGSTIEGAVRAIRFSPTDDTTAEIRKAASATINPDGSFVLFTRKPGDGVFKGKYDVTFVIMTKPMGGESLIKPKFSNPDTTPYTVVVDGDKTDLEFEIEPK